MFVGQLRISEIVVRFFEVDNRDDAQFVRLFGTPLLALRRDEGHVGQIRRFAFLKCLLAGFNSLPFQLDPALFQRGFGLSQGAAEVRAVDGCQNLSRAYLFAGFNEQRNAAGSSGIERRADRCDNAPLHGHITNKITPGDDGRPDTIKRHADRGICPALYPRRGKEDRRDNGYPDSGVHHLIAARILRCQPHILGRSVSNFQLTAPQRLF